MSNSQCVICFDEISGKLLKPFHCTHIFHEECINKWLFKKKNNTCPTCRSDQNVAIVSQYRNNRRQNNLRLSDYISNWKYPLCIEKNHPLIAEISGVSPFGVLIHCKICNKIQGFNRIY